MIALWILLGLVVWTLAGLGLALVVGPLLHENAKNYPLAPGEVDE